MDSSAGARTRKRKSRGRGLRTTTGCLTCRKRHLKCDGVAPECGPCSKSQRPCSYASTNGSSRDTVESSRAPSSDIRESQNTERVELVHRAELRQREEFEERTAQLDYQSQAIDPNLGVWDPNSPDQERTQAASGLLYLNSGGPFIESDQILSPNGTTTNPESSVNESQEVSSNALTPPDAAFSRWFSLLTSDAAHATTTILNFETTTNNQNQDRTSPIAQRTSLLSPSQSVFVAPVHQVTDSNFEHSSSALVQLSQRQPWHGSEPSKLNSHEQALFENYVKKISTWIDLFDPKGHFSSFVPHLAMHDAGLMNAILALSARHLYLSLDANDQQRDANIGIQYYNETLHYLQKAMRFDTYTVSHELLATALIVSTYEMLDEFGTGWERHLQGVFWIQRSQLIQGESKGFKQAVWWAWLRQDVWAAFRERRKTFSFWKPTRAYKDMYADELALRSIWLFARAVDYCSTEEIKAGESDLPARIERAETILGMLDEWQSNLTIDFTPLPTPSNLQMAIFEKIWVHPPAFAVSIQLHHSARILLLLHSPSLGGMLGYMKRQRLLEISAETICGLAMTLTDNASSIMSSQCLFVAGLCTHDTRKRTAIVELIDQCQMRTGWPTKSFSEELKVEWKKLDSG